MALKSAEHAVSFISESQRSINVFSGLVSRF